MTKCIKRDTDSIKLSIELIEAVFYNMSIQEGEGLWSCTLFSHMYGVNK